MVNTSYAADAHMLQYYTSNKDFTVGMQNSNKHTKIFRITIIINSALLLLSLMFFIFALEKHKFYNICLHIYIHTKVWKL